VETVVAEEVSADEVETVVVEEAVAVVVVDEEE